MSVVLGVELQMIISLEGVPAIGKSTTSQAMANSDRAFVVSEVNMLFARPKNQPEDWYLSRQVARWEIGIRQLENFDWIIFDGDLFQPLWFSWIYNNEGWNDLEYNEKFYREQIIQGRICFPDVYFLLSTTNDEIWKRALKRGIEVGKDEEKIRYKFERYKRLVEPQKRYFEAFHANFSEKVKFLDSVTLEENLKFITSISQQKPAYQDIDILDFLVSWLRENKP
jgi:thymidylate kinase